MEIAKEHAQTEFEKYRVVLDRLFKSDFDRLVGLKEDEMWKSVDWYYRIKMSITFKVVLIFI